MKFLCIDLKSFYASVECLERNLDPLKAALVVCDTNRGEGSIFLASTPKVKEMGIKSRSRLFEVPKYHRDKIIFAKPRMKKYIEYSALAYEVYLEMFDKEDIFNYSIDEVFIDVTSYLTYYNCNVEELAGKVVERIKERTRLTCCVGSGDNMFLAKIALDILAKKQPSGTCYLDLERFKELIWNHQPITDIWRIGPGTQKRLYKYGIKTLGQLANTRKDIIIKEFGIIGEELYEHAWGIDTTNIKEVKMFKPINKSLNNSQMLDEDVEKEAALIALLEMADTTLLKMIEQDLKASSLSIDIGYSRVLNLTFNKSIKFISNTNSYQIVSDLIKEIMYNYVDDLPIKKIGITFSGLTTSKVEQLSIFDVDNVEEVELYKTLNELKERFGKSSVLKAISYTDEGTQLRVNKRIGGHNSE
ncbi:MAG: DNA repair protein [bacterium]